MDKIILDSETILEDNYPVYYDYIYLVDGVPRVSFIKGDVARLKLAFSAKEIRRCDIVERSKRAKECRPESK